MRYSSQTDSPEAWDAEIEWALTHNIEPADHIAGLTRVPQEPVRLSPEQEECAHPEEGLTWDAYRGVFNCGECGAQLVIPELAEALDKKIL